MSALSTQNSRLVHRICFANSGPDFRLCAHPPLLSSAILYSFENHELLGAYCCRLLHLISQDHIPQLPETAERPPYGFLITPGFHPGAYRGCFRCLPVASIHDQAAVFRQLLPATEPDVRSNQRSRLRQMLRLSSFFFIVVSLIYFRAVAFQTHIKAQPPCHGVHTGSQKLDNYLCKREVILVATQDGRFSCWSASIK